MPASIWRQLMTRFQIRELGPGTWPDFARIMEKHNGVWGGCWCVAFHVKPDGSNQTTALRRAYKEGLVRANRAHAALVYDGTDIVGWCQFGPPAELGFRPLGALGTSKLVMRRVVRKQSGPGGI